MENYCPECVVSLVSDKKKLGNVSNWKVCPKCGYRIKTETSFSKSKEVESTESWLKEIKSHNHFSKDEE